MFETKNSTKHNNVRPLYGNRDYFIGLHLLSLVFVTSIKFFFLWKLVRWWRHRLDRFIFQYFPSPGLYHTQSLSLWHPVCPSFALWHSQWDASVWSEGASMMSFCKLVDRRLCWWSVIHALHTSLKGGVHCCCTSQHLQIQSLLPRFGGLCPLWHWSPWGGWVCLSGVLKKSQNPDHHRTCYILKWFSPHNLLTLKNLHYHHHQNRHIWETVSYL